MPTQDPPDAVTRDNINPQVMFDRSRQSGFGLLQLLLSLATAVVAVYFVALTDPAKAPNRGLEFKGVIVSLTSMVCAIIAGVIAWGADAIFYQYWAYALEDWRGRKDHWWRRRNCARQIRKIAIVLLGGFFLAGMIAAGFYLAVRVTPSAISTKRL